MRLALLVAAFAGIASAASAETWNVQQERSGVWVGTIDHYQIGGPCERPSGGTLRSDVRAVIAGDNLFAFRASEAGACSYIAKMEGENRARGIGICEGVPKRFGFVIRFRAPQDQRPMREIPPDDELLTREQRRRPDLRYQFDGIDDLFAR
jgi:hypothetical protein